MKKVFKAQLTSVLTVLLTIALFASCKKKDGDGPNSEKFPLSNLTATITKQEDAASQSIIIISFDIKNISSTDYYLSEQGNNPVKFKLTVVTTDGTKFEETSHVTDVAASKTSARELAVHYSSGKTVDLTKSKIELLY